MNTITELNDTQPHKTVATLMEEAEQAALNHNRQLAHKLSLQATKVAPDHIPAWALRIRLALNQLPPKSCLHQHHEMLLKNSSTKP